MRYESPDEINKRYTDKGEEPVYRCRPCRKAEGLYWYRGTSCPTCGAPACLEFLNSEWSGALRAMEQGDDA